MSNRGRGRGGGVKPNDRSSSSSPAASSRGSSLTRPTTSSSIEDADRLMKQFTNRLGAGSVTTAGLGANTRPAQKFIPNLATSKKDKDKTDSTLNTPPSNSNNDLSSINKKDTINGNKSQISRGGGGGNYRGIFKWKVLFKVMLKYLLHRQHHLLLLEYHRLNAKVQHQI